MSVTEKDVRDIAALARVGVADERVPALVRELNGILAHMDALQAIDVSHVNAATISYAGMPLRPDVVSPVVLQRSREAFAPVMREGFFLVPRLDTHVPTASTATLKDA